MGFLVGHHSPMALCSLVVQASTTSIPFAELLPHSHHFRLFPHSQQQSSASICSPNPTFQHPALVYIGGKASRAGWARLRSVPCVQVSLCPAATHCLPCSLPTENEAVLLSKLSCPSEGLPRIWGPLLIFFSLQGCRPQPPSSPLLFPSFFCPTLQSRNLSCPFRFPRASASV